MKLYSVLFKLTLLFYVCFGTVLQAYAQTGNVKRVELETKYIGDEYYIIPAGNEGVLVVSESDEKGRNSNDIKGKIWHITKYDTDFNEKWDKEMVIPKKFDYKSSDVDLESNKAYFFFTTGTKNGEFWVKNVDLESGKINNVEGIVPFRHMFYDFKATNGVACLGGSDAVSPTNMYLRCCVSYAFCFVPALLGFNYVKIHPALYVADVKTGKSTLIPTVYEGAAAVSELSKNPETGNFTAVIIQEPPRKEKKPYNLYINEYNGKGRKLASTYVKSKTDKTLFKAKIADIDKDTKLIAGAYGTNVKQPLLKFGTMTIPKQATGFYATLIKNKKQKFIKYYSLAKLKSFWDLLNDKYKKKMERRADKKKKKGKELEVSYNLLFHDFIQQDGQNILIAEAYYGVYHYVSTGQGQGYWVFDGWQFTHAIILAFDNEGNKLWDHSFEFDAALTMMLREHVSIVTNNDEVALVSNYGGNITAKTIKGGEILDEEQTIELETGNAEDKLKKSYMSSVEHWYDNYFLAYGFHQIKDKGATGKKKRKVFYFNKIKFD